MTNPSCVVQKDYMVKPKPGLLKGDLNQDLLDQFLTSKEVSVDCEMMGLNPFRDRLCLVQVAMENGPIVLIQVHEESGAPLLKQLLESETIQKIFHYARMDTLFLELRLDIHVHNIFCTKLASRLVRTYTDKHSLKELVREISGVNLEKSQQSSDWGSEKLSREQIEYAAGDVIYLFEIKRTLTNMLERENRMELATKILDFMETRRELDRLGFEDIFAF